jgi:DNA-3-methyladenine glycosylase
MPRNVRLLKRAELPVDTTRLARFLIGKTLVRETPHGRMSGRIVETEAYLEGDAAAHSYRGMTARNRSLFLERGHAYVYFIYGTWYSINVSGATEGVGAGVLLRALEPLDGIPLMQKNRPHADVAQLARGPGCLATALDIDRRLDGLDLCRKGLVWLGSEAKPAGQIVRGVRIGITKEAHRLLRFFEKDNPCVSGPKRLLSQI